MHICELERRKPRAACGTHIGHSGRLDNCMATIHMDPIATDDEYTLNLKDKVCRKLCDGNNGFSIHDFRVVKGDTHTNVIFDLAVPHGIKQTDDEIRKTAKEKIHTIDPKLIPVMHIEKSFIE